MTLLVITVRDYAMTQQTALLRFTHILRALHSPSPVELFGW